MVKIEIHGHADEVRAEMAGLLGVGITITQAVKPMTELVDALSTSNHAKTTQSPKETKKAEKVETKSETKAEPKTETKAEPAAEGAITVETIRGTVSKLMVKVGREKTVKLLEEFGAKKGGELKEADYPKFLEKANAALA